MVDEISNDVKLWGEFEDSNFSKLLGKTVNTNEQDVIINSITNTSQKKYFFNPESQAKFIPVKKDIEFIKMNNTMKEIIQMLKYRDEMKDIVEKSKLKRDIDQLSQQISSLPVPRLLKDEKKDLTSKQFSIHHESDFVNGIWDKKPPVITTESALNTLSISIATILAYTGFTETTVMPLQVLTEIIEEYIMKMLKLLKYNVEKEKLKGESGFCDVVDRTFHEMGIGSMKNLIVYYQNNIIDYKKKKTKEVKDELRVCENIIEKIKEDQKRLDDRGILLEDEHSSIPELHVTSMIGNELLSGSFETGLQMLHTIENQQLTEVDSNSVLDSEPTSQNEYNDAKAAKRKKK